MTNLQAAGILFQISVYAQCVSYAFQMKVRGKRDWDKDSYNKVINKVIYKYHIRKLNTSHDMQCQHFQKILYLKLPCEP
jgi:hypothetical protein